MGKVFELSFIPISELPQPEWLTHKDVKVSSGLVVQTKDPVLLTRGKETSRLKKVDYSGKRNVWMELDNGDKYVQIPLNQMGEFKFLNNNDKAA